MQSSNNPPFFLRFLPFLMAGLMVVLFVIGLFVFSWILIGAAIVGFILFIVSAIRAKFSSAKNTDHLHVRDTREKGRTIDYDQDNDI